MSNAHDELNNIYQEFRGELNRLAGCVNEDEDPFRPLRLDALDQMQRRLIVRSAFAAIDAIAFRFKQIALEADANSTTLTQAERALCTEEQYELTSSGEPDTRSARLRFLPNLRFAFRIASRVENVPFSLDVSGSGWQALQHGLKVRHRLTHPKSVSDLVVTDAEARGSIDAFLWVEEQIHDWLKASNKALKLESERLRREIDALKKRRDESAV